MTPSVFRPSVGSSETIGLPAGKWGEKSIAVVDEIKACISSSPVETTDLSFEDLVSCFT